jgi:hypothetical protein
MEEMRDGSGGWRGWNDKRWSGVEEALFSREE